MENCYGQFSEDRQRLCGQVTRGRKRYDSGVHPCVEACAHWVIQIYPPNGLKLSGINSLTDSEADC